MAESGSSPSHPGNGQPEAERLAQLRSILLGPERAELRGLLERLDDPERQAREVSRVLPAAITLRAQDGTELAESIAPIMDEALKSAVRRDPQPVIDAIFPVIGPAIRRAIAAAMSELVQSLNQALDHTLSIRGLRWRWESIRTGVSFAEVVLRHSLVYRVEQILLIHRESGLLLQHLTRDASPEGTAEMVAGMLTAIQDFARDSFKAGAGETLETMQVGGLIVWVEPGPAAVLAAVIRGQPPQALRPTLQRALEAIHGRYGPALTRFNGDTARFADSRPLLEPCLCMEATAAARPSRWGVWAVAVGAVALLAAWAVPRVREHRRWETLLAEFRGRPGIVVVDQGRSGGHRFLTGLRDPLADDPRPILAAAGIDSTSVDLAWRPYVSLDSAIVLRRATTQLLPPAGVRLEYAGGVLGLSGAASHEWVNSARDQARGIPGVDRLQSDSLKDRGPAATLPVVGEIERTRLLFDIGAEEPLPASLAEIAAIAARVRAIQRAAGAMGLAVEVAIAGSTDGVGKSETNAALSRRRAERVRALLAGAGVAPAWMIAGGAPVATAADAPQAELRRVSFTVSFSPLP